MTDPSPDPLLRRARRHAQAWYGRLLLILASAFAWSLLFSFSAGTGLLWTVLGPRLEQEDRYSLQAALFSRPERCDFILVGDQHFLDTMRTRLPEGASRFEVHVPGAYDWNLRYALLYLSNVECRAVFVQNVPALWTDARDDYLFGVIQDMRIEGRARAGLIYNTSDGALVFNSIEAWAKSKPSPDVVKRAPTLLNTRYAPERVTEFEAWFAKYPKNYPQKYGRVFWVYDPDLPPEDLDPELLAKFLERFASGADFAQGTCLLREDVAKVASDLHGR